MPLTQNQEIRILSKARAVISSLTYSLVYDTTAYNIDFAYVFYDTCQLRTGHKSQQSCKL